MASESSFDVVSKVDRQEVDNALNQAAKEVRQRFDFKNTDASIRWSGEAIEMEANSEERVKAWLDVFQSKLIRDEGPKGVKAQIQGDELRVSSKKRDDLQAVQKLIKDQDYDFAVQFTNYR